MSLFFSKNKVRAKLNIKAFLSHCKIIADTRNDVIIDPSIYTIKNIEIIIKGIGNKVIIKGDLRNNSFLKINITGDNNTVEIGECGYFQGDETSFIVNNGNRRR